MKMFFVVTILSVVIAGFAKEVTVEMIIDKINDCSDDIAIAEMEYFAGKQEIKFYKAEAMPTISFSGKGALAASSIDAMGLSGNTQMLHMLDSEMKHFNSHLLGWAINIRQPIITFGKVAAALRIAKVRDKMLWDTKLLKKSFYYLKLFQIFSDVYLRQQAVIIETNNYENAEKLLDKISVEMEGGNGSKRDSLRVLAQMLKAHVSKTMESNGYNNALERFSFLTEINYVEGVVFSYNPDGWASVSPKKSTNKLSHEFTILEQQNLILHNNIAIERSKLLPNLSLFGNMGSDITYLNSDLKDSYKNYAQALKSDAIAGNELSNLPNYIDILNPDYWNFIVGLQLNWTIFDGRRSIANFRKSKITYEIEERKLKIFREENEIKIREANETLSSIIEAQQATDNYRMSTELAYKQTKIDYDNGFADYSTLLSVERELKTANLYKAQLEMQYLLAIVNLKINMGLPLTK